METSFNENMNNAIGEMLNEKHPKELTLDDKILIGCNNCGNCCINTNVILNAYDFYNIVRSGIELQDFIKDCDTFIGENSGVPMITIKNKKNGYCPFLKNHKEELVCSLGPSKPMTCDNMFVAVGKCFQADDLKYHKELKDIEKIDIDEIVKDGKIENQHIFFMSDINERMCEYKEKKEVYVRDYLYRRILHEDECSVASIIPLLTTKYFDTNRMFVFIKLAEESKVNSLDYLLISNKDQNSEKIYARLINSVFSRLYFYFDPKSDVSFMDQTIEHLNFLQDTYFPAVKVLYENLISLIDKDILDNIISIYDRDPKEAQNEFDIYYARNIKEISERFVKQLLIMAEEVKKIKGVGIKPIRIY